MTLDLLRGIAEESKINEASIHDLASKIDPTFSDNEALHSVADSVKPVPKSNDALHKMARPLKSAIHSVKDALTSNAKKMPNRAMGDDSVVHGNDLVRVASEALQVNPGEVRFVIHLPYRHLKDYYLQTGGGQKLAGSEVFTDDMLRDFIADPSSGKSLMFRLPDQYTLHDISHPKNASINGEMAILIDVPRAMADKLKNPNLSLSLARKMLERVFNHKYYVMTLNTTKLKELPENLGQNSNKDEMVEKFNPYAIENYPIRQVLAAAKQEWNEQQDAKKEVLKKNGTAPDSEDVDSLAHAEAALSAAASAERKKETAAPEEKAPEANTEQPTFEIPKPAVPKTTEERIDDLSKAWKDFSAEGKIPSSKRNELRAMFSELKKLLDSTWREEKSKK